MKEKYIETIYYGDCSTTIEYSIDMDGIKEEINQLKMEVSIYTILAYVYDLFQNNYIPEGVEEELYTYIDPKDKYNEYSPAECWWSTETHNNPLIPYCI